MIEEEAKKGEAAAAESEEVASAWARSTEDRNESTASELLRMVLSPGLLIVLLADFVTVRRLLLELDVEVPYAWE